jgi:hypothetical protein
VAAFYRHDLSDEHFMAATGRSEPVSSDSAGLILFGGAEIHVR